MSSPAPLIDISQNPVPDGGEAFWFDGFDGGRLRGAVWPATADTPEGTVVLLSGRTEFIEKYFETVTMLRERGFAVATLDWRGQGMSVRETDNPLRGHADRFSDFDRDFALFLKQVAARNLPAPLIGLAHSMGGHIALRWLYLADTRAAIAQGLPKIGRMVLSAPMVDLAISARAMLAMRLLSFIGIAVGLGKRYLPGGSDDKATGSDPFEGNLVTSDPQRFARQNAIVAAKPDLRLATPTLGWGGAAIESMDFLQSDQCTDAITTPVLFAGASRDGLIRPRDVEAYAKRLANGRYILCEGAKHEILMERDDIQKPFWEAFDAFVGVDR